MPLRIKNVLLSALTCTITSAAATSAFAADPTGDWRVADGVANIRVAECNGKMWGVVSWEKIAGGTDKNNPDASKKSRPTLAMPTLLDMKKKPGTDQWEGQVYNAKDGQTYSASIKPLGPDQLQIQGCVLGFLCGGETWTRVGPPIPSSSANAAKGSKTAVAQNNPANAMNKMTSPKPGGRQGSDVGDICVLPDIARLAH